MTLGDASLGKALTVVVVLVVVVAGVVVVVVVVAIMVGLLEIKDEDTCWKLFWLPN